MPKHTGFEFTELDDIDKVSEQDHLWFSQRKNVCWRIRPSHPIEWKTDTGESRTCVKSNTTECAGCNMLVVSSPTHTIRVRYIFHGDLFSNPLRTCPWLLEALASTTDQAWLAIVEHHLSVDKQSTAK